MIDPQRTVGIREIKEDEKKLSEKEKWINLVQEQERIISDLRQQLAEADKEISDFKNDYFSRFLQWRSIETPCKKCGGSGRLCYGDTSTWSHGIGGQAITEDVCEFCWGTGDANRTGANLRIIYQEKSEFKRQISEKDKEIERLKKVESRFDLETYLKNQIVWSKKTFGDGPRASGISDHIKKELVEIAENPRDLFEWIDVIILALDGAWRAGYSVDEVTKCLIEKQQINLRRRWGKNNGDGKAIEHIRDEEDENIVCPVCGVSGGHGEFCRLGAKP